MNNFKNQIERYVEDHQSLKVIRGLLKLTLFPVFLYVMAGTMYVTLS